MRACARACATTTTTTTTRRARRGTSTRASPPPATTTTATTATTATMRTRDDDAPSRARATPFVVVLSPAKALDERASTDARDDARETRPRFVERARAIARRARELKVGDLKTLMGVSDAIAKLNVERFGNFEEATTKACALAFDGPAFKHLKAATLKTDEEKAYLQRHLRILSGLYGCLRPYDAIAPYRLEMGTKWAPNSSSKDLYAYWGEDIALAILDDLDEQAAANGAEASATPFVVNCASQEYWKSVKRDTLTKRGVDVYTMTFPGPAVYAKQARGAMVRHCVDARVSSPDDLKTFTGTDGCWTFDAASSSEFNFVFARGSAKSGDTKPAKKAKKV